MKPALLYFVNKATAPEISTHLIACDAKFTPPLSDRVEIREYAKKIVRNGIRFEAWSGNALVGLVAAYCNDHVSGKAYITSVSVIEDWTGKGIALKLMNHAIEHARRTGMHHISLQVGRNNTSALSLYQKLGFDADTSSRQFIDMNLSLKNRKSHDQ